MKREPYMVHAARVGYIPALVARARKALVRWRIMREANALARMLRQGDVFVDAFGKRWTVFRVRRMGVAGYVFVTATDASGFYTTWTSLAWAIEMQPVMFKEEA